jgi:hypothetical protein
VVVVVVVETVEMIPPSWEGAVSAVCCVCVKCVDPCGRKTLSLDCLHQWVCFCESHRIGIRGLNTEHYLHNFKQRISYSAPAPVSSPKRKPPMAPVGARCSSSWFRALHHFRINFTR